MGREVNIDSIMALDKRIEEIKAELTRLKRSRNSLLNVARIPPEILGRIFHLSVMPEPGDGYFPKLQKGSYNFILVYHHWYRVARNTPELWSFWGNKLEDWKWRYLLSGPSAPVDLVLDQFYHGDESLDEILRDVLRDRAARDTVRKVHIASPYVYHSAATAVISLLTPEDEGIRHSSIESIALSSVDASDFFSRHHFPNLRDLYLFKVFSISCWDHLKSHTVALVSLTLIFDGLTPPSVIPTTSQVLSLLASNPNIRSLVLQRLETSDNGGNSFTSPVPLRHLERLLITGDFHHIFPILHRLELPERVNDVELEFRGCKFGEAHEIIGPYIRDYLRRDPRFEDRLGVFTSSDLDFFSLRACTIGVEHHDLEGMPSQNPPHVTFRVVIPGTPWEDLERLCVNTLALLPRESIVYFKADLLVTSIEDIIAKMPNIEHLHLVNVTMRPGFLLSDRNRPDSQQKLLPSLRRLCLEGTDGESGDWRPLVTYLTCQTSGDQAILLSVFGEGVHICVDVLSQIYKLVEGIRYVPDRKEECPTYRCPLR